MMPVLRNLSSGLRRMRATSLPPVPGLRAGLRRPVLWLVGVILIAFLIWAANAPLDEVTNGQGKVIPISRGQIIQNLEGGILAAIFVREGDEVEAGQPLAEMDDTAFLAAYEELYGKMITLRASLDRLQAELAGKSTIDFDPLVEADAAVKKSESDLFNARRTNFTDTVSVLSKKLELARENLSILKPLTESGSASKIDGIEAEREVVNISGELDEFKNTYYEEIAEKITEKRSEIESVNFQIKEKKDALSRTVLRSPVRGVVKNLSITTRGGVVKPGQTIMEIVPLDDKLYVEAKIKPRDVAFLHVGQKASVKISAYDYAIYGALDGELVFVSADTIEAERAEQTAKEESFYRVRILTDTAYLNGPDGPLPIKPGMVGVVDIKTGRKTVLSYLLDPILSGQTALRER